MYLVNTSDGALTIVAIKDNFDSSVRQANSLQVLNDSMLKKMSPVALSFSDGAIANTSLLFEYDNGRQEEIYVQERISEIKLSATAPANNNISSVADIDGIEVANGTVVGEVPLPETVVVHFADGQESLAVTWDGGTPAYDEETAGEYEFEGTITLPDGITNTGALTASIVVTVLEAE